jgi:hypothetical protein
MKVLFVLLSAFLMVFFLGCQENSITDPGTTDANVNAVQDFQNLPNKDMISYYPGIIKIFDSIYDPTHPQNGGDQIKGFIRYNHRVIAGLSSQDHPRYTVKVGFYVDLALEAKCPMHNDCMKVVRLSDQTVEFPPVDNNAYQVVEKVFRVSNTCCGPLDLIIKFSVDRNDVGLLSMTLKKVSSSVQIGDPT